jgi:sarcosine oxidase
MFTNTPDHHFVIDVHPDYPQVSIASPCSGHGFKFASVVGEVMADLAEKGFTRHDISLFRLDRLRRHAGQRTGQQPGQRMGQRPGQRPETPAGGGQPVAQTNGHHKSFERMGDIRTFW